MNSVQYALKKDLDSLELKMGQFTLKKDFTVLSNMCKTYAL